MDEYKLMIFPHEWSILSNSPVLERFTILVLESVEDIVVLSKFFSVTPHTPSK